MPSFPPATTEDHHAIASAPFDPPRHITKGDDRGGHPAPAWAAPALAVAASGDAAAVDSTSFIAFVIAAIAALIAGATSLIVRRRRKTRSEGERRRF